MSQHVPHKHALEKARRFATHAPADDGLVRESYKLPRDAARQAARQWLNRYPAAAYWSRVECWKRLDDDRIEFTMVRLPTAD
ncbi:MAG: hypothetical protein ACR2PF_12225 [Rhizobiaceae bacterium]